MQNGTTQWSTDKTDDVLLSISANGALSTDKTAVFKPHDQTKSIFLMTSITYRMCIVYLLINDLFCHL